MTVWVRIAMFMIAARLFGAGMIGEEVKEILTTDPLVVESVDYLVSAGIFALAAGWRWLAKRYGWST